MILFVKFIAVFTVSLMALGCLSVLVELAIKAVKDHQGDPYVTLSDRKIRLEALKKKSCAK